MQRAIFLSAGGKDYEFIPCLNERDTWIRARMMFALENLLIQRNYVDSWCSLWQSIKVSNDIRIWSISASHQPAGSTEIFD